MLFFKHYGYQCIYFLILIGSCHFSYAQSYQFKHYTVEQGLSHSTVLCTGQDSSGFIWIGTKAGLNRFDGYHFRSFPLANKKNERGLFEEVIYTLASDRRGRLWVGTKYGLFLYNNSKETFTQVLDSLSDIYSVYADSMGSLWLISKGILYQYDCSLQQLKKFPPSKFFYASSVCQSKDGTIWVSTQDGFLKSYNRSLCSFTGYDLFEHSLKTVSKNIEKIFPGDNNSLYIATSVSGIKRFDITQLTYKDIFTINTGGNTLLVRDIIQRNDNEFWFATETGILIYNSQKNNFIKLTKKWNDPYSLSANEVYSLFKDRDGGVWTGTYFGGLNYYSTENDNFEKYFPGSSHASIGGSVVREICGDRFGNLWIGTEDGGLNKLNLQTKKIDIYTPMLRKGTINYWNIHGLMVDEDDLWIGTFEHGLDILDIKNSLVKRHESGDGKNGLFSNFIFGFLKHSNGEIYIATSNGVYRYSKQSGRFEDFCPLAKGLFVYAMIEDHNHVIWMATDGGGLLGFDRRTNKYAQYVNKPFDNNSLTNNRINALCEDSFNNIWLATEGGGVCRLDSSRQNILHYTIDNGLPSNYICKIIEDNNKKLWFTTSKGLVAFNPNNANIRVYTKANGLLNDQFNYQSGYKDENGRLYFGSIKGMISFNPKDLTIRSRNQPVLITSIQANSMDLSNGDDGHAIPLTKGITLPYNRSSVNIEFAAIGYEFTHAIEYKYLLNGLQKDWNIIKSNRKVYFTNLPPGKYTFRVKAAINGQWNSGETTIQINILSPLWATTWAYIFYIVIAIIITYFIIGFYREKLSIKKEKEIYEAKLDFFTRVAHEIKTPLSLIIGPLEGLMDQTDKFAAIQDDVELMHRNAQHLSNLVSQALDFRATETKSFGLHFTRVNIVSVAHDAFLLFEPLANKRKLQYSFETEQREIFLDGDPIALDKVFNNLFSNAVKYAKHIAKVTIKQTSGDKNTIEIFIQNDGYLIPKSLAVKIFEPFYRIPDTAAAGGSGIGLSIAKSFVELHNGTLDVNFDEIGFNTFVLNIPIKRLK